MAGLLPKSHEDYTDKDGVVMEWDAEKCAFFPKIDATMMNAQSAAYGGPKAEDAWKAFISPEGHPFYSNSVTNETTWVAPTNVTINYDVRTNRRCFLGALCSGLLVKCSV